MRAGPLNRVVRIERPTGGQDSLGQPIIAWAAVATVWADIRHQSGLETVKADQPTSVVKVSIRIRYRSDLDASMRVVYGASVYDIRAVLPDERGREYLDLACEIGASNG